MQLLQELLVPSCYGEYDKIIKVIVSFLQKNTQAKVIVQKFNEKKANVLAIFGKPLFLINAHMDTVVPSKSWSKPIFELSYAEDKVYGLGTCDTKGNIYAVLKAVQETNPTNLALLFSFDEESGSIESGVTHFLASEYAENIKKALVLEPTNLKFIQKHKGYFSYFLSLQISSSHSSLKQSKNNNAIVRMAEIIPKIAELDYNVAKIEGGEKGNIIPDFCKILLSIRNYKSEEENYHILKNILSKDLKIEKRTALPSLQNDNGEEVSFWTEASLFAQKGIKAEVFGAGSILQAHKEDEFVEIYQLQEAINILKDKIRREFS